MNNHWTNNLKRLNISRKIQANFVTLVWRTQKKNENSQNYKEYILPTMFSLFLSLATLVDGVHNWIISEDFMCALSRIFADYCFFFSFIILFSCILFLFGWYFSSDCSILCTSTLLPLHHHPYDRMCLYVGYFFLKIVARIFGIVHR